MKKQLLSCCLAALGLTAIQAQSFNEWKDPEVNSVNRSAMHTNYKRSLEIQLGETRGSTSDRLLPD